MKKTKLLDIFNPLHNIREVCKELVLLEDHLVVPGKHCPDCIRKHLLRAEAFAEEAIALDKEGKHLQQISFLPQTVRNLGEKYSDGKNKHELGQRVRALRKKLAPLCFKQGSRSSTTFDFWSAVSSHLGVPDSESGRFIAGLKRSAELQTPPYFKLHRPGVAVRVRSGTEWVSKELTRRLRLSPIRVMISRAINNGQEFSEKEYHIGILQALGRTGEKLDIDMPASSLGEYVANRRALKFALKKALDMNLLGLIRRARKAESYADLHGCSPYGIKAANYYARLGQFTKDPYFHAKAAHIYERCGKSAEEIISLRNILVVSPQHVLRFYIVNKVVIAEKTAEQEVRKLLPRKSQMHTGDPAWFDKAKKLAPFAIGIAIGLA